MTTDFQPFPLTSEFLKEIMGATRTFDSTRGLWSEILYENMTSRRVSFDDITEHFLVMSKDDFLLEHRQDFSNDVDQEEVYYTAQEALGAHKFAKKALEALDRQIQALEAGKAEGSPTTDPGAVFDAVIEQWRGRCKSMAYRLGSRQRYEAQAEFFTGAMSVMIAQGVDHAKAMPPGIVLMIMAGRDILAETDGEDYPDEDDQDEDDQDEDDQDEES